MKDLLFATATAADAAAIATLRTAVAADLTARYGTGHWSSAVTERSVLHSLKRSRVLLAQHESDIVGVLRLATKKPWVIDPAYFHAVTCNPMFEPLRAERSYRELDAPV